MKRHFPFTQFITQISTYTITYFDGTLITQMKLICADLFYKFIFQKECVTQTCISKQFPLLTKPQFGKQNYIVFNNPKLGFGIEKNIFPIKPFLMERPLRRGQNLHRGKAGEASG
ncbi:MAG: hypothetical protein ABI462_13070 [Ignavibacteria bacterium]